MIRSASWQPNATLECLRSRARLLASIRGFFHQLGVMEVETPVCSSHAGTDPSIDSLSTMFTGPGAAAGRRLYLQTSPEFSMKRLLAAGGEAIYQICRVFRDGEAGRFHNPEFTLLEWYRPGFNHHRLMDEVSTLVRSLLPSCRQEQRLSYRELFHGHLGVDPHHLSLAQLQHLAEARGILQTEALELQTRDGWLDLLLVHCIEPELPSGLCFVYDYPESQASLARVRPGIPPVAERFELYLDGMELANGFHELADPEEQRRRFQYELEQRQHEGRSLPPVDEHLLAALEAGLPDCSGVALGIDRLLMRITGASHIDEVLAFPFDRA